MSLRTLRGAERRGGEGSGGWTFGGGWLADFSGSLDDSSVLATIGLYQDGVMKKDVDGKETIG